MINQVVDQDGGAHGPVGRWRAGSGTGGAAPRMQLHPRTSVETPGMVGGPSLAILGLWQPATDTSAEIGPHQRADLTCRWAQPLAFLLWQAAPAPPLRGMNQGPSSGQQVAPMINEPLRYQYR